MKKCLIFLAICLIWMAFLTVETDAGPKRGGGSRGSSSRGSSGSSWFGGSKKTSSYGGGGSYKKSKTKSTLKKAAVLGATAYGAYQLGAQIVGTGRVDERSWSELVIGVEALWLPLITGCGALALICAIVGYVGIQLIWRAHILHRLALRRARKSTFRAR